MDPRFRVDSISVDVLRRIASSCDDHWAWLSALNNKHHNIGPIPIHNVLKSPVRRTAAAASSGSAASSNRISKDNDSHRSRNDTATSHGHGLLPADPARANAVFASTTLQERNSNSNSANSFILRSPGKVNLQLTLTQQSPSSTSTSSQNNNNNTAQSRAAASKNPNPVADSNKENSSTRSPAKANHVKSATHPAPPTSLRSPQVRNILTSSTSSRQYQHNSPSSNIPLSPRNTGRSAVQASPTPRPVSRIAVPRCNNNREANENTSPQKVVDDVFLSGANKNAEKAEEENEEEEEDDQDDEQVADILLGYTKTPATARKGALHDSSMASQTAASPGMAVKANSGSLDKPSSNKLLPPLPISKPALMNTQYNLVQSKTSPPRPLRSPSRPSPTPPKQQARPNASNNTNTGSNVIQSRMATFGGGSPVKRDMSNLESIASVLNSPTKQPSSSTQQHQQIPTNNNNNINNISRPGSPTSASSRVPVPRPGSPSSTTIMSNHTSPKPTTTSRLRSPIIQAVKSLSPPPLRSSSRLATSTARPGSPLPSSSSAAANGSGSASGVNSPTASPKVNSPIMKRPQSPLRSPRLQLKKSKPTLEDAPTESMPPSTASASGVKGPVLLRNVHAPSSIPTPVDSPARKGTTTTTVVERPTSPTPLLRSPRLAVAAASAAAQSNKASGSPSGIARPTSPIPSQSSTANTASVKSPLRHQLSKTLALPKKKDTEKEEQAQAQVQQHKTVVFPMANEAKSPVKKSVREDIEARLLAAKSPVKAAAAASDVVDPAKEKENENYKAKEREIGKDTTLPSAEDHAVKAKDFVDAPSAQPHVEVDSKDCATTGSMPPAATLPESIPKKAAPPRGLSTAHLHNNNNNNNAANIPPSPVFSSFLSQNPARPSALSFIGLQNRILGGGGNGNSGNTSNAGTAANGAGSGGAGAREKSVGLGLGLSNLSKSLGNGLHAQQITMHNHKEDQDSQGTTASSASSQQTSFFSATSSAPSTSTVLPQQTQASSSSSSKKRVSSTMDAQSFDAPLQANKQARIDGRTSIVTSTQADDTRQRLDLLRSRISNIKSSNRTSSAATSNTMQNRTSIAHSAAPTNRASIAVLPSASASATAAAAEPLFSPPLPSSAAAQKPHSTTAASSSSSSAPQQATSASSAFASAVAAFVPAPSFGSSFVSLFSSSLAPSALSASTANLAAKATQKANEQHTSPVANNKAQMGSMYPSLPSVSNLAATLSPRAEVKNPLIRKNTASTEDGEEEEVLQDERASPVQSKRPALIRASSGSSVHDMIKNFEAKATSATLEKEREATLSPIKPKVPMFVKQDAPARPTLEGPAQAIRSTTPPFSPPAQVVPEQHTQASASGELEVDIEDLAVEAIARASSQDISDEDREAEEDASDADMEDGELSEEEQDTASQQQQQKKIASKPALSVPQPKQQERAKSATPFFDAQESDMDDQPEYQTQSQPVRSMKDTASKPAIAVLPASQPSTKSAFKPKRPTAENASVAAKQHRPPSRAPSVTSLAPSRASTISINSTSNAPLGKSTMTKKGPLAASTSGKPEVKSLQLAAAAAKKEQLDKERKAVMKEDRDNKRAAAGAASAREAEVEKDKKRKDRDELAQSTSTFNLKGKAPAVKPKIAVNKTAEDEPVKKRKVEGIEVVIPAKPVVKKTTVVRTAQTTTKTVTSTLSASTSRPANLAASSQSKALAASASAIGHVKQASSTTVTASSKTALYTSAKAGSSKPGPSNALLSQHQQAILQASTSLAKSQTSTSSRPLAPAPKMASDPEPEPFELPEVDSEYSDSDEETQAKKAALRPDWTQSPELRQALAHQANFNPDELFGAIPQLQMEEMFKNKSTAARLRPRTSSMHWTGTDALTAYEEQEYARRMGYRSAFFTGSSQQQ